MLAPIFVTVTWIATDAPRLISIIAITAATPMITPSMVSVVRITLRRSACKAIRTAPRATRRLLRSAAGGAGAADESAGYGSPPSARRRRAVFDDPAVGDANHPVGMPRHIGVVRDQQIR